MESAKITILLIIFIVVLFLLQLKTTSDLWKLKGDRISPHDTITATTKHNLAPSPINTANRTKIFELSTVAGLYQCNVSLRLVTGSISGASVKCGIAVDDVPVDGNIYLQLPSGSSTSTSFTLPCVLSKTSNISVWLTKTNGDSVSVFSEDNDSANGGSFLAIARIP